MGTGKMLLSFGFGNAKLPKTIATFSLPAGHTCPGALECLARADRVSGRIQDGKGQRYRCSAVSSESRSPELRAAVWRNLQLLEKARRKGGAPAMRDLILASLPDRIEAVRIHVNGDFYSPTYRNAWILAAIDRPHLLFYAYTKSVHLFPRSVHLPGNLRVTFSLGGKYDALIGDRPRARVVFHPSETKLPIDHTDQHARENDHNFALLLHGTQPAGSEAARAKRLLQAEGFNGYSNKRRKAA